VASVPSFTCISRATSAIGRDSATTILTASSRNSGLNFLRFFAACSLRRSGLRSYGDLCPRTSGRLGHRRPARLPGQVTGSRRPTATGG
jgi:hypothetical protein